MMLDVLVNTHRLLNVSDTFDKTPGRCHFGAGRESLDNNRRKEMSSSDKSQHISLISGDAAYAFSLSDVGPEIDISSITEKTEKKLSCFIYIYIYIYIYIIM